MLIRDRNNIDWNNPSHFDLFRIIIFSVALILFSMWRISACIDASRYQNFSVNNVKRIGFYEYLRDGKNDKREKGKVLIMIDKKEDIKYFLENYWKKLDTEMGRSWGKEYLMVIELKDKNLIFSITNDKTNKYAKIIKANSDYNYSSIDGFKSYKLYKYFDILEKKEKELNKNRDK